MKRRRKIAVLAMPTKVLEIIARMRVIILSLTGNLWFPVVNPTLATIETDVDNLEKAEAAAAIGGANEIATRDNLLAVVIGDSEKITTLVQSTADGNVGHATEIITSASYFVKGAGGKHEQIFNAVSNLPGNAKLTAPVPDDHFSVAWFKSLDGQTWDFAGTTYYASIELNDLTPDTLYYFKHFMNIKRVPQGYSPVISCRTK